MRIERLKGKPSPPGPMENARIFTDYCKPCDHTYESVVMCRECQLCPYCCNCPIEFAKWFDTCEGWRMLIDTGNAVGAKSKYRYMAVTKTGDVRHWEPDLNAIQKRYRALKAGYWP